MFPHVVGGVQCFFFFFFSVCVRSAVSRHRVVWACESGSNPALSWSCATVMGLSWETDAKHMTPWDAPAATRWYVPPPGEGRSMNCCDLFFFFPFYSPWHSRALCVPLIALLNVISETASSLNSLGLLPAEACVPLFQTQSSAATACQFMSHEDVFAARMASW